MYTSDKKGALMRLLIYIGVTVFCVVFFLVYDRFSHGVHSPFMTFMFAIPMALGVIPCGIFLAVERQPGRLTQNLWNSGVAMLTISSGLRGVFEIAGTSSDWRIALTIAGAALLMIGAIAYIAAGRKRSPNNSNGETL